MKRMCVLYVYCVYVACMHWATVDAGQTYTINFGSVSRDIYIFCQRFSLFIVVVVVCDPVASPVHCLISSAMMHAFNALAKKNM